MFDVRPTQEQKQYATNLINNYNFGRRGHGDGNHDMQYIGMLGQTILADLLGLARPNRRIRI